MLTIHQLAAGYGPSKVLFDINLEVGEGEVVTLLGRNGMGKTTSIRAIMGLLSQRAGAIEFKRRPIDRWTPEAIARAGIGLVPEGRQVFPLLTLEENLIATAANRLRKAGPWTLARVYKLFPNLQGRRSHYAHMLSGGEQQMVAIGRALMTNPDLLILDEATEGLAPIVRADIWRCLSELKSEGLAILIVDKNLQPLRRIADRHCVIEKGRTVWSGRDCDLAMDHDTIKRYVGI